MKKSLAWALGAMLTIGSAAPAAAASQVDFSGYYRAHFLNEWNGDFSPSEGKKNDSYFVNRLELNFGFHPTDEIAVYWRLRAPDAQRWGGSGEHGDLGAKTKYVYGEVTQDWGTLSIGRLADSFSALGLATLGWYPEGVDDVNNDWTVFGYDVPMDGVRWAKRWDNDFQLVAQFNRVGTEQGEDWRDEQTADLYTLEGAYFWEGGGASLGLSYLRDHVLANTDDGPPPIKGADVGALKAFYINPAIAHSWENGFSLHFESKIGFGKNDYTDQNGRGYAFYLDADYNYGPGHVNLAGWWVSGHSGDDDGDTRKDIVGMGEGFGPLLVAYNPAATGWGRNDIASLGAVGVANSRANIGGNPLANHWALDLNGSHAFRDDVTLAWAVAYLALNKAGEGYGKSIGVETDLALRLELLDNLNFTTSVGYLFSGRALDIYDEPSNTFMKAADAMTWYNSLTFSF